jgi:outer membrane protein assembly factor BamA
MIRLVVVGLLLGFMSKPAAAQEPWRSSYFPYLLGNPTDGAVVALRWQRTQNAPYFLERSDEKDVVNPLTFRGAISAEAGIGTLGSRWLRLEARVPGLAKGWRFQGSLAAERQGRYGFYGFGSDLDSARQAPNPNANAYRTHRQRWVARAELTRTISGPLRVSLGASFDRTEFSALPGTTLFGGRFPGSITRSNLQLRPALVLDTRDREFTPNRGVLVEAGAGFGTGPEGSPGVKADQSVYALAYAQIKAYQALRPGTVVAVRGLIRTLEDQAPLSARSTLFGWEREFNLAGAEGHRSFPTGALVGTDVTLLSLDLRHDLLNAGDLGAVSLVGFADYANVDDPLSAKPGATSQWGGGAGVALRILRSAILSANFAGGSHGFNFSMGTGWAF